MKNFTHATTAELEAELNLYADAGVITADEIKALETNAARVGVIESLQASVGVPVELTEDMLANDPSYAEDGKEVGQVVIVTEAGERVAPEQPSQTMSEEEQALKDKKDQEDEVERIKEETKRQEQLAHKGPEGRTFGRSVPPSPATAGPQLFFKGKAVISHGTSVHRGKLYHDVVTHEASYLLTREEFNREVTQH